MANEDQNKLKCIICGGDLCWDNDFNASDVYGEDEVDENDPAIISYMHCICCGREYQISDPLREERETIYSNYWNHNIKK